MVLSVDTKTEKHRPGHKYHPRTISVLQQIFKDHFYEYEQNYASKYANLLGDYRIIRFKKVSERFIYCGDYTQGIARIHCDSCGHDHIGSSVHACHSPAKASFCVQAAVRNEP